ncbi:uncharacterized protein LOC125037988 [Penaeus chinensis]|uniref:uncharacterized protein LOC125037988 n=1 Tax=Penaeus chinensis TaxID=139456 RepID=UPI001FB5E2BC|nr:uncharacterized protein LOC125037988 [Penaeus chinensis]
MKVLVIISLFATAAFAAPQGYSLTAPSRPGLQLGSATSTLELSSSPAISDNLSPVGEQSVGAGVSAEAPQTLALGAEGHTEGVHTVKETIIINEASTSGSNGTTACKEGEILHVDGSCVVPVITRKVFIFNVPQQEPENNSTLPELPPLKVEHNILFVRLPEAGEGPEPIIVPPPKQNNIVYVLNKQNEQTQRVIEVPAPPPSEPEIYFVDYKEGENPSLPGGVDLLSALGSASETGGEVIGVIESSSDEDTPVVSSTVGLGDTGSGSLAAGSGVKVSLDIQAPPSTDANILSGDPGSAAPSNFYITP